MIRLFRVWGIPVRLDAGWLLVFALIAWSLASGYFPQVLPAQSPAWYWVGGVVAALLLFGSVFLHELAHALVAHVHGVRVAAITLHVFGGVSELETEPPHPRAEVAIAVVGPLTSLAIAGGLFAARQSVAEEEWLAALLGYVALVNVVVGLFNLAPGFPLDGGRILRAMLWWWSGRLDQATRVASRVGSVFAMFLVALGLARMFYGEALGGLWFVLLALFLYQAARASRETARLKSRLAPITVEAVMTRAPITVDADAAVEHVRASEFRAENVTSLPVVEDGRFVGFLRRADVEPRRRGDAVVADAMVPAAADLVVGPDDSAWLALTRLSTNRVGGVAVVVDGQLVGIVSRGDLERTLAAAAREPADRAA